MLWKFSFATGSTLDTLLSRENPPSVEEILDEQDVLAECKAQNNKLVTFLSRKDSVKSLLSWVTNGLDDLDTEADKATNAAYKKALASKDAYPSFKPARKAALSPTRSTGSSTAGQETTAEADVPQAQDDVEEEEEEQEEPQPDPNAPFRPGIGVGLGAGLAGPEEDSSHDPQRSRYPQVAAEILTSELWTIPETVFGHKDALLRPFWDRVLPPINPRVKPLSPRARAERERARNEFWSDEDEERERKREVIRGLWMRVNASLLQKRSTEMIRFIQSLPNIVERLVARIESPAIQDMLARIIQAEENGVYDVMNWLGRERLVPRLLALLSPEHPPSTHAIAADLLKGIISVSAPNSSFNPQGGNAMDQQNGSGARDNRLVRELTNQESIATLVGYMLDNIQLSDQVWKGLEKEGEAPNPANSFVTHPLPSIASATSSLCYVCNVIVEVIRRNNSDLAEPFLFNTIRNRLMALQSDNLQRPASPTDESASISSEKDDEGRGKMEAALPELSEKLAIVHLGNLVAAITERFGDLDKLLTEPRSQRRVSSSQNKNPLTLERFRVIELYAELLHSSNMATLNRVPGTGPEYTAEGVLTGGLDGLDKLGAALQAGENPEEEATPAPEGGESHVTAAKDLPISSSGSTDYSLTESDDVPLSDEETESPAAATPTHPAKEKAAEATTTSSPPPPPSAADAERLRQVLEVEASKDASKTATPEAAPAVSSQALSTGERLKQQFINYSVLPTLLDLFFQHASNNFLHHLVYDILQQILNGNIGRGYNRELVIDLFTRAKLIDRILEAQALNDRQVSESPAKPRLPYMGHISLIAEELIKLFGRCPDDLAAILAPLYDKAKWDAFVDGSLRETRARDSQPLAGGKPMTGFSGSLASGSEQSDSESDDDDTSGAVGITVGEPLSRTLAKGIEPYTDSHADDEDGGIDQFWPPSAARAAALDSSDDDDDDADWLRPSASGNRERRGDDDDEDDFGDFQASVSSHLDDDEAWGTFTSVSANDSTENPFGDDAFAPPSTSTRDGDSLVSAEPLTPRDWAEAFERDFDSSEPSWDDGEEVPSIVVPADAESEGDGDDTPSSWSFPGDDSDHGEDLPSADPEAIALAHGASELSLHRVSRRHSVQEDEIVLPPHVASLASDSKSPKSKPSPILVGLANKSPSLLSPRRHSHMDPMSPREEALERAATPDEPMGPGVDAQDTHLTATGMVERDMPDGSRIVVPADEVALGLDEAEEHREHELDTLAASGGVVGVAGVAGAGVGVVVAGVGLGRRPSAESGTTGRARRGSMGLASPHSGWVAP